MFLIDFLHNFEPQPIIFRLGFLNIYWYSCLVVLGILLGLILIFKLRPRFNIKKELLENLFFYLIISGFLGARLYDVLSELPYYIQHPWQVFAVWQGGLGIYGAIIVGILVLFWFCKKHKLIFLSLADLMVLGLILGQAIGRWGNYFNQEIFGKPTNLPWGIPIQIAERPAEFLSTQYFHPTFLYESIWNFFVFIILIFLMRFLTMSNLKGGPTSRGNKPGRIFALYLILYSFGRFFLEFLRIDPQPVLLGLRLGQVFALIVFILGLVILMRRINQTT